MFMTTRQKKIIVPVDFSAASLAALKAGAWFSQQHQSELVLLYVVEHAGGIFRDEAAEARRRNAAENQLNQLAAQLAKEGVQVSLMFEEGKPYKAILKASEDVLAEMIVMGAYGDASREYGLAGSNTTRVIRAANCPVLSVRDPLGDFDGNKLMIPVDPQFGIRELRSYLQQYHEQFNPEVVLVSVAKPKHTDVAKLADYLSQQRDTLHKQGISKVRTQVLENSDVTSALLSFAATEKVDMIWMETHGREGVSNLVLGSITEEVLNQSSIPVLSLHPVRKADHTYYSSPNLPV
jgi:nucleotide-binding universal stress UspA family protein